MNILSIPMHSGLNRPPHGGQNRSFNLIQQLEKHGNDIIVLEPQEFFDLKDLELAKIYTHPNYRVFGRGWNLFKDVDIWFVIKLVQILRREPIDLIVIEHPSGTLAVKLAAALTKTNVPVIYGSHNVDSDFARDVISQVAHFSQLERKIVPPYVTMLEKLTAKYLVNHIIAVSDADKDRFCSKYGLDREKVTVIPSGCELSEPLDAQTRESVRSEMGFDLDSVIVVFHGSYGHPPNREAIDKIIGYIAPAFECDESIIFALYGTGVPKFERANVRAFGFVEDLHKALSIADIALVPLTSGGGTKLKVFDYMNAGLPIVTTRKGIEGINANDKEHLLIVECIDDEVLSAIEYLAKNRKERERLGFNARRLVENVYNWDHIGDELEKLIGSLES